MPVMDGLTATRLIRKWEAECQYPRMPILALTANALSTDVESALQAGCDRHLSKPLTKRRLIESISQYEPLTLTREVTPAAILLEIPEELEELVPSYLEKRREELSTLTSLLQSAEYPAIQRICHNIKGSGTSYGFEKLSDLGHVMETAAKNADADCLTEALSELSSYLRAVQLRRSV